MVKYVIIPQMKSRNVTFSCTFLDRYILILFRSVFFFTLGYKLYVSDVPQYTHEYKGRYV